MSDPTSAGESRAGADPVAAIEPPTSPAVQGGRLRRAALDLGPLRRSREFRLLFFGQAVSFTGSMITYVALPYQVWEITRSSLAVGLLGLAELVPLLVTALVGGAIADAADRRRVVLTCELGMAAVTGVLVVNSLGDAPALWILFVLAGAQATLDGLQRPSLEALLPRVVERADIPAAVALSSLRMNIGMVAGPPLAGLLIATAGLPTAYLIDVASFGASLIALSLMKATPPAPDAQRPSVRGIVEGLRYARSRPDLLGTYLVDINAMLFGMPNALFPAIAAEFGGAEVLGLLYAAPSVGSMVATLTSGWTGRVRHHGRAIVVAAGLWGVAVAGFGLAPGLAVALLFLACAGAADMVSGLFRSTVWNQSIPDELRGRLAGVEMLSYTTGPLLGNVRGGAVASAFGARVSVAAGGIACVVGTVVLAMALPALWHYDAQKFDEIPL